jgi:hypothetical protein
MYAQGAPNPLPEFHVDPADLNDREKSVVPPNCYRAGLTAGQSPRMGALTFRERDLRTVYRGGLQGKRIRYFPIAFGQ